MIIHITSEIVIIGIILYWTNKRYNKLLNHIVELNMKINEQENVIESHSKLIEELFEKINKTQIIITQQSQSQPQQSSQIKEQKDNKKCENKVEETESELDNSIEKELAELDEDDISNLGNID